MEKTIEDIKKQVSNLVLEMTLEEKIGFLSNKQSEVKRLKIREYQIGGEAAHGAVDRSGGKTTSFPQPLGLSQTWNPKLMKEIGTAVGKELRILYQQSDRKTWLTPWAPTIDMERDPRWGRNEEAYGEDPYLTGKLSTAFIQGMQGEDPVWLRVAASPKHFYGNNNEILRESTSNSIDIRNREEYYLKAFEPAFKEAKAQSMMTAYNGINGVPGMQHEDIEKVVRERWGMEGFIVSDGGALTLNVDAYHYYDTYEEALADALKKGIDCFVDDKQLVESAAKKAWEKELITEEDIDRAVKRTLTVRGRLGHFEETNLFDEVNPELLAGKEHAELVKKATAEQTMLLKNDQILPLTKNQNILLTGPLSDVWLRGWYGGYSVHERTIRDGLRDELTDQQLIFLESHDEVYLKVDNNYIGMKEDKLVAVSSQEKAAVFKLEDWDFDSHLLKEVSTNRYIQLDEKTEIYQLNKTEVHDWFVRENLISLDGMHWQSWNNQPIGLTKNEDFGIVEEVVPIEIVKKEDAVKKAVQEAQEADVCVVAVGNHPMINGKETMDRPGVRLPSSQMKLVQEIYAVNPNVVVVVIGSYPFEMEWINQYVPGILFSTHGSQELGQALTDILFHKATPTGKLSQTWYNDVENSLPDITNYDVIKGERTYRYTNRPVDYPFGHGLTYGSLTILSCSLNKTSWEKEEEVYVTVKLKNDYIYEVTDTVQCYVSLAPEQKIKLPKKQLIAFSKVTLQSNEVKEIILRLENKEMRYWDPAWNRWVFPSAQGLLSIGFSSVPEQTISFRTIGESRRKRDFSKPVHAERYDDYKEASLTINAEKERVVRVETNGWLMFQNVHFTHAPAKLSIRYSAEKDGTLRVYKDFMQQEPIASQKFSAGENRVILIAIEEDSTLYFSPDESISLITIQEVTE